MCQKAFPNFDRYRYTEKNCRGTMKECPKERNGIELIIIASFCGGEIPLYFVKVKGQKLKTKTTSQDIYIYRKSMIQLALLFRIRLFIEHPMAKRVG